MKKVIAFAGLLLPFVLGTAWATSNQMGHYDTLSSLEGEWKLAPASQQEGGATAKGPAAGMLGTDRTAMSFRVIGKGSTVQESLLPGTGKEMATMYHCNDFKACSQVKATHYCAKQNQPRLVLDEQKSGANLVAMKCDMNTPLCNSKEAHVHGITHELSDDGRSLKTTYIIYKNRKLKKNAVYHFTRK